MENRNLENYTCTEDTTVVEAMTKIDISAKGILFVVTSDGILIGTVTDGDIRRWLIKTADMTAPIKKLMNCSPKFLFQADQEKAAQLMKEKVITAVPIVNADQKVLDIVFAKDYNEKKKQKSNTLRGTDVIIMAGGKGTRLYPYTKILPKPLIPIGDVPILEHITNRFSEYGIEDFYLTVNYKKGMIKSYFNELDIPYRIHYVEEDKPLGTAGSIKLIEHVFEEPVIVTNCDILIDADYSDILAYHKKSGNVLTVVSALKNVEIPYGVLHTKEQGIVTSMEEKPKLSYFVNSGMYVLNPELIEKIPQDTFFHMTDLVDLLMQEGKQVGMYPVSEESFLDMGEFEEMRRMEEKLGIRSE